METAVAVCGWPIGLARARRGAGGGPAGRYWRTALRAALAGLELHAYVFCLAVSVDACGQAACCPAPPRPLRDGSREPASYSAPRACPIDRAG